MRATGEVAVSRLRSAEDYRAAIGDMLAELERLSFMVEQLLQLSRLDAGTLRERFSQIPGSLHGGAGLGLALAADIAAVHGGCLVVANSGCPGARFEWTLPLPGQADSVFRNVE